ncbi:MAG: 2-oxoglutarate dehydrogenase E1 component [Pirellulaceae bacterium]
MSPGGAENVSCYNAQFVEQQLDRYLRDPRSVTAEWRKWFSRLDHEELEPTRSPPVFAGRRRWTPPAPNGNGTGLARASGSRNGSVRAAGRGPAAGPDVSETRLAGARLQDRVGRLVDAFRTRGHLAAKLDPLGMARPEPHELNLAAHGFDERHAQLPCPAAGNGETSSQSLAELVERLRETYCRYIGVQFMHIDDPAVRQWLIDRMEPNSNRTTISRDEQLRILTRLTDAAVFEEFVRKKFVGAKTFSLEGAESLIPLLDLAIAKAAGQGVREVVLGMAHRGRLNVLANVVGKRPSEIFWEFQDSLHDQPRGSGDVKYHLGASGDWVAPSGDRVHLSLCFNPSHLEYVNPVAEGRMRAKQQRSGDVERRRGLVLLIHGDAAFAGEGIVQETLNLSQLPGYATGGTLHIVVNNQLGFTTSPAEARSMLYASDAARLLQIPIFHVNGEQPESVAHVVNLALDFRALFQRDVVIDLFCYRRWGHNEGDEPSFTQPRMYEAIEQRESVREGYLDNLLQLGGMRREEADEIAQQRRAELGRQFEEAQESGYRPAPHSLTGIWDGYQGGPDTEDDPGTGVPEEVLNKLLEQLTRVPPRFEVHRKLKQGLERRRKMAAGTEPLDWSAAEALALATLACEGHPVRLTGQDSERGTFSQRHAVLHDVKTGERYPLFEHLESQQAQVEIVNSPLCEAGTLGFEYGFSLDYPEALVAWEAQYGDFVNAAQVIIDQFLASAEFKWQRLSGLVLLLPHGFEGMGPEHSSARLERFLSLAAADNMQIACPSKPAQYFHLLRRQVKRRLRKPLIVLTPKSLLRHRRVASPLSDLAVGTFQRVLLEHEARPCRRLVLCSGKFYYDLLEYRERHTTDQVALASIEQFYPLSDRTLLAALTSCLRPDTEVVWAQEEPANMGAARYWQIRYGQEFHGHRFRTITRAESASPATGSRAIHQREQDELLARVFSDLS